MGEENKCLSVLTRESLKYEFYYLNSVGNHLEKTKELNGQMERKIECQWNGAVFALFTRPDSWYNRVENRGNKRIWIWNFYMFLLPILFLKLFIYF